MTTNANEIKKSIDSAITDAVTQELSGKKFWLSKTFWTNILVAAGILIQLRTGFIISPEYQALGLTLVNLALRKITREPVIW